MIDSHFHFDMSKADPVEDMLKQTKNNNINGVVVLLNDETMMKFYCDNLEKLRELPLLIHPVLLVNPHDVTVFEKHTNILNNKKIEYSVKLYPRLSNISKEDFNDIQKILTQYNYRNIVVDAFYYGSHLQNHISNELAIFLAESFPEKKIIIAHFGGFRLLETYMYTRDLKNVFYDFSFTQNYFMNTSIWNDLRYCIKYNKNKAMFGSDYPSFSMEASINSLNMLIDPLGDIDLKQYVTDTNARFLYLNGDYIL